MAGDNGRLARMEVTLEHHSKKLDRILNAQDKTDKRLSQLETESAIAKGSQEAVKSSREQEREKKYDAIKHICMGIAGGTLMVRLLEFLLGLFG